jgi:hypothetical protein
MAERATMENRDASSGLVYVPAIAFVVHLALRLAIDGGHDAGNTTLGLALFWLVGVNSLLTGSAHITMPAPVARTIGWPTSPFQWEVGLADISYGLLGVMAPLFDREFWLATIIAFCVFMLGAAVGHMRSMIRDRNFAPGNAGYFFWYDLLVPTGLLVLYAVTW